MENIAQIAKEREKAMVKAHLELRKFAEPSHIFLSVININPNGCVSFTSRFHELYTQPEDEFASDSYVRYTKDMKKYIEAMKFLIRLH